MPGYEDPELRRRIFALFDAWPEDNVMVRGPYAPERTGLPFILPATAHC